MTTIIDEFAIGFRAAACTAAGAPSAARAHCRHGDCAEVADFSDYPEVFVDFVPAVADPHKDVR